MKKLVSILLSLVSVICVAFAFTGCEDKKSVEENAKLTEENRQLAEDNEKLNEDYKQLLEENEKLKEENGQLTEDGKKLEEENWVLTEENKFLIEENGIPAKDKVFEIKSDNLYTLKNVHNNGLLKQSDLKSIACHYYETYKIENNPYSGLFNPNEELSEETATKIKRAYLRDVVEDESLPLEGVEILNYYGTYNGNVAVNIHSTYISICPGVIPSVTEFSGVEFPKFWDMDILVYHI